VGDVSVLVLVCGDARTKQVYLTTRQAADREKLFQASIANAVQQMMLAAASMNLGTVWVSVREEVEPELRKLFQVPPELRLLWVVPIGHARSWPKAKPRRSSAAFTHWETYDGKKLRPRLEYSSLAEKLISLSVKSGLAQFDLNDDPGFEKIVVTVMPGPMG
jgi:hypothetical protein